MSKMREFKIISGTEEKIIEATSFKKGEVFVKEQKLPIGRKKKIGR